MNSDTLLGLKITVLCLLWYVVSAANNVIGKVLLQSFGYPTTVTLFQFLSITVYSIPALRCIPAARRVPHISWKYYFLMIVPLAFGKFFASVTSHISLWSVPVSYAHTVKASMPLFVVLLSRVLFGERQTTKVYLSLVPIILGVLIASVTELEFNFLGLIMALFSIFIFSLQNIYSKKALKDTKIHHLRLLYVLAKLALLMFIPFWVYHDLMDIVYGESNTTIDGFIIGSLLFMDGLCNFLQNTIAFTVLSLVTPLTYSVCNASKRIAVITCSILMLKNPVTYTNIFGMTLAIFGVFYYNKAKLDARKEPILPTKTSSSFFQQYEHSSMNSTKPIVNEKFQLNRAKSSETNLLLKYVDNGHLFNGGGSVATPRMVHNTHSNHYDQSNSTSTVHSDYLYRHGDQNHLRHNITSSQTNGNSSINMFDV